MTAGPHVALEQQHVSEGATGVSVNAAVGARVDVRVDMRTGARIQRVSTVPRIREPTFAGRDDCLRRMEESLRARPELVLCGPPGVGKSRLLVEYARRASASYPGGMFFLRCEDGTPITDLVRLLRMLGAPPASDEHLNEQSQQGLHAITALSGELGRALVLYDAVPDLAILEDNHWLPPEGADLHILVSTTHSGGSTSWPIAQIQPLSNVDANALASAILGDTSESAALRGQLVDRAGGVTMELVASAQAVAPALRYGRQAKVEAMLAQKTVSSFEMAWRLLSENTRLLLRAASIYSTRHPPTAPLRAALMANGWSADDVDREIDAARERGLASGVADELHIHQLVANFVRQKSEPSCESILPGLWSQFVAAGRAFLENPANVDHRALLIAHEPSLDLWSGVVEIADIEVIGEALLTAGMFQEAQPWFLRVMQEAEHGDRYGRVDHQSLGRSVHQIGFCLWSRGRYIEGQPWFERAVQELEQGDVHGGIDRASLGRSVNYVGDCLLCQGKFAEGQQWFERAVQEFQLCEASSCVDHESLGNSVHLVGDCLANLGKFAEAQPWFLRAAQAKQRGDVHGRIDHESLGSTVHLMGHCLANLGKFAEAQPWFERAVQEKERGDVHGRVDHASLGRSVNYFGHCLLRQGRFVEALSWGERAVRVKVQGDVHRRVDHVSLGSSMHLIGDCFVRQRKFSEALSWGERAVREKEQGDVHRCVDHESLGSSVHLIGDCLLNQGKVAEAQPWFERAVREKEQGGRHARVDHDSVGHSVHQVGSCLSSYRKFAEAQAWFERAAQEKEHGDLHGRVDHESLARSVHQVGYCLASQGKHVEAQSWFERADRRRAGLRAIGSGNE